MTTDQYLTIGIISLTLMLFISGRLRYDIVALIALFSSAILGLIPLNAVFSGFAHPATITVVIVLILSQGLTKSGAVEGITRIVDKFSDTPSIHIGILMFISTFISMFMNNVGALAVLMPIAIQSTLKAGRSPSTVLMSLSFGSILGGMATLIGTPPNMIISIYRENHLGAPFTMFDFTAVGASVALVGILFMTIIGWRLVQPRKTNAGQILFDIDSYLFEIKVTQDSKLNNISIKDLEELLAEQDTTLISLVHKNAHYTTPPKRHILTNNDMLLLKGAQESIDKLVSQYKLVLLAADSTREEMLHASDTVVMEFVLAPGSRAETLTVEQVKFKKKYGINLLAVSREGKSHRQRLKEFTLKAGDVLLVHGSHELIEESIRKLGFFPLAERGTNFGKRKYALLSLAIFIIAITLSTTGLIPIQISLGCAVVLMVLFNIIPAREIYDEIAWPIVVLLGAMIPVGNTLESTGTTHIIANGLLSIAGDLPIAVILTVVLVVTMTLSDILNNVTTAILMAPIAATIAKSAGVSPDPFLMAVAIGASCAFLTPIGHQNNALVMGPGGYKFSDYWRVGLPLEIIIVIVSLPLILKFWPL